MKASELTGAQLDWAVAECEGKDCEVDDNRIFTDIRGYISTLWRPSRNWAQAGPIIERREIALCVCGTRWEASCVIDIAGGDTDTIIEYGPTPLIAAMRTYVASKLGDEVDVPF